MSTRIQKLAAGAACILGLMVAAPASAVVVAEVGDAGDLVGTAQTVAAGTTQITGLGGRSTTGISDVDVFEFGWGGGALTIDTGGSSFDTMLYLFDDNGFGIAGNDDAIGLQSRLTFATLAAGDYLVAISNCCVQPVALTGQIYNDFCCGGQPTPNGPGAAGSLTGWEEFGASSTFTPVAGTQSYQINFSAQTTATAAEPGTAAALGLGLLAFGLRRRRRS